MATTEPREIREIQKLRRSAEHRYAWRLSEREHQEKMRAGLGLRILGELAAGERTAGWPPAGRSAAGERKQGGVQLARTLDGIAIALKAVETWGADFDLEAIAKLEREVVEREPLRVQTGTGTEDFRTEDSQQGDSLWIVHGVDALVRGDAWGFLVPGRPSVAAELAWRHLSSFHEGSRLYAGMFAAACVSVAFVADDLLEAVYVGLGEVPDESRLSRAVAAALRAHRTSPGWPEAKERLGADAAASNWDRPAIALAHGVLALLFGEGDPRRTWALLGETAFAGSSLNGMIGSIIGVQVGVDGLPGGVEGEFPPRVGSKVGGLGDIALDELVHRAMRAVGRLPGRIGVREA